LTFIYPWSVTYVIQAGTEASNLNTSIAIDQISAHDTRNGGRSRLNRENVRVNIAIDSTANRMALASERCLTSSARNCPALRGYQVCPPKHMNHIHHLCTKCLVSQNLGREPGCLPACGDIQGLAQVTREIVIWGGHICSPVTINLGCQTDVKMIKDEYHRLCQCRFA